MLIAESNVDLAGQAATIATFAIVASGGAAYLLGSRAPLAIKVDRSYDHVVSDGVLCLKVQARLTNRTRHTLRVTNFTYGEDPFYWRRKWRSAVGRTPKLSGFRESSFNKEKGLALYGHSMAVLSGLIPMDDVRKVIPAVVVMFGDRPFFGPMRGIYREVISREAEGEIVARTARSSWP